MTFRHPLEVRFRDVDALGHVNHAVLVTYLEVARTAWWGGLLAGRPFSAAPFVIAHVDMDYRRPVTLGEPVLVELEVARTGRTSFDLAYRVLASGELAATGATVQVMMEPETGRPRPLDPGTRAWLEAQA